MRMATYVIVHNAVTYGNVCVQRCNPRDAMMCVHAGPTPKCPGGEISINVRASVDRGLSWGAPHSLATPDDTTTCQYADGSAIFDADTASWHYLVQVNSIQGPDKGWGLAHFFLHGTDPLGGTWTPNPHNPVVKGGQLFDRICGPVSFAPPSRTVPFAPLPSLAVHCWSVGWVWSEPRGLLHTPRGTMCIGWLRPGSG